MDLLLLLGVLVVAVVGHEAAHALAARAVGHTLFEVQVGAGPITSFRIGDVDVRIGPVPVGGSVQTGSPEAGGFRWRTAVVAAAGPAVNVVLAVACLALGLRVGVAFNVVAAAANLWPGRRPSYGEPTSDGRVLLDLLRGDEDAVAAERSAWWAARAVRARDEGRLDDAAAIVAEGVAALGETRALLATAGAVAFARQRFAEVVDAYVELIDDERVSIPSRAAFAADAAWAACLSGDPAMGALARPWADLGVRLAPRDRRRRIIRGLALVDGDDPAAGLVEVDDIDDPSAHAVAAVALAALGRGEDAEARARADVVGALAPDHPLLGRVRAAVPGLDG